MFRNVPHTLVLLLALIVIIQGTILAISPSSRQAIPVFVNIAVVILSVITILGRRWASVALGCIFCVTGGLGLLSLVLREHTIPGLIFQILWCGLLICTATYVFRSTRVKEFYESKQKDAVT